MSADPESGEDLVAEAPAAEPGDASVETDPHLLLYRLLFEEVQSRISNHYRSLLTGLSVVGLIIGYALLTGELVFLAVVPVVIAVLFVQTVRHLNGIMFAGHHLHRIEREYADEHPMFVWETRYGITGSERTVTRRGINWSVIPAGIMTTLGAFGYAAFAYVGYVVWPPDGIDILVVGFTRGGLLVLYVLLTAMVCLVGYSYYLHRQELAS